MLLEDISDLWIGGRAGLFERYQALFQTINREGKNQFLEWLTKDTDFFTAPASANGHNNYEGGLVEHSLRVYYNLNALVTLSLNQIVDVPSDLDSLILVALTHDICKANFYKGSFKQKKRVDGQGQEVLNDKTGKPVWDTVPYFTIEDQFPLGHGEKSVIILQRFMTLTDAEIMAIRWHMGGFDDTARSYAGGLAITKAMGKYPLVALLHCADLIASLPEKEEIPHG
jgi:hypothetical protein